MEPLHSLLDRFEAARRPGGFGYAHHHHHDGGSHDHHLVIGAIIHGDEVGSLPAVVSLIEALNTGTKHYGGRLTIFLGNPEASAADRRFLDADLNRVFIDEPPPCHEGHRARELKPMLDAADVFVDLHQTILDTDRAFYIFPFDEPGWQWARAIGAASTWVTRAPTASFSSGTCCSDEYVRLRGKPGLTLELGPKGFHLHAEQRATTALDKLLAVSDAVATGPNTLASIASDAPELDFVHTTWSQPFDNPRMRLIDGLTNFQQVTEGQQLSAADTPPIHAPHSGLLLFPKYPGYSSDGTAIEPRPGEIARIVQPLSGHPSDVWARELNS